MHVHITVCAACNRSGIGSRDGHGPHALRGKKQLFRRKALTLEFIPGLIMDVAWLRNPTFARVSSLAFLG